MKKFLTLVIFSFLSVGAFAQATQTASTASTSGASNQGVNLVNNSYAPAVTTSQGTTDFHTNQAQAVPPSFSSQSSIQTCSAPGAGFAVQLPGGGISAAAGTGMDPGCDLKRDIDIMVYIGAQKSEMVARACMKPEIQKVMAACKKTDPVATNPYDPAQVAEMNKQQRLAQ